MTSSLNEKFNCCFCLLELEIKVNNESFTVASVPLGNTPWVLFDVIATTATLRLTLQRRKEILKE